MNRGIFITVGACLGFMSLIMALFLSRFYTPRELTLDEYKTLGAYFIDPPRQLAEFKLIDDTSKIFLPEEFAGKWNILFFGFTYCPDICPLTMKQMSDVKESLGEYSDNLRVFLVSVDPDRDKPENLRQYLDNFDKNFKGLTGEIDQIYKFLDPKSKNQIFDGLKHFWPKNRMRKFVISDNYFKLSFTKNMTNNSKKGKQ